MTDRHEIEQRIARDLELCDLGESMTRGKTRRRFVAQRKVCFEAIRAMNHEDGLDTLSNAEMLAELQG